MAERLAVSPIESSVILLNEIFTEPPLLFPQVPTEGLGHYSEEVAKALHNQKWRQWYHPETNPLKPEDIMQDAQRSQSLIDTQDRLIETLTPREQRAIRLRFGKEDSVVHSLKEIGKEFGVKEERSRQILARALRKLIVGGQGRILVGPEGIR